VGADVRCSDAEAEAAAAWEGVATEGRSAATVRMSGGDDAAALRYSRANEDFGEEPLNDTERPGVRTYTPRKRLGSRSPPWKGVWAHEVRAARHG